MARHNPTILVTGYPYAFPYYRNVFAHAPDRQRFLFALPKTWRSKSTVAYRSDAQFPGFSLRAWSYGRASFLGGIWKGWLPALAIVLLYCRIRYNTRVLYSCLEPNLFSTLYNGICARIFGCRHVLFTWQNVPSSERLTGVKRLVSDGLVRLNLLLADGVVCGNTAAERLIHDLRPHILTVRVPLAGVDTDHFRPRDRSQARQTLDFQPNDIIFLFYGALDKRKGLEVLIQAFADAALPNGRLIIVGRGPLREMLERLADDRGVSSRITFIEWMNNSALPAMLNAADVFVYPSVPHGGWEEQFGYAMAEASACGLPVVATHSGSIAEVVVDGQSGILVPPDDSAALAQALERLASDGSLRASLGAAGRAYMEKHFSHRAVAQALESFLKKFL